jgi:hypothetical protein
MTMRRNRPRGGDRRPGRNPPAPIDLLLRYVTAEEAFGGAFDWPAASRWIGRTSRDAILHGVAYWLSRFDQVSRHGWQAIEREFVDGALKEPHRSRVLGLLERDRMLVTPQSLLIIAKLAMRFGSQDGSTDTAMLLPSAVALQSELGGGRSAPAGARVRMPRSEQIRELVRNQAFHSRPDVGTRVAQAHLRWRDLPARREPPLTIELVATYEAVTGVPLADLQAVGFTLYAKANEAPGTSFPRDWLAAYLKWESDRAERVLKLIAAGIPDIVEQVTRDEAAFGDQWSFDALRQFPIVQLDDGSSVVLSPFLLLERTLGWLPFYDMTKPPQSVSRATKRLAAQAEGEFRLICEQEVVESLVANGATARRRAVVYDGATMRAAYPDGEIADAAMAYDDAWVVVEVSSRQLQRGSVVGGHDDALEADLIHGIDEKVSQLQSTIDHIRADETSLTGQPPRRRRRRFVPVLVIVEGFPLNPLTYDMVHTRLTANHQLEADDIAPLAILETDELYLAETLAEGGRTSLLELLDQHGRAGLMRRVDLKSWLILEGRIRKAWPDRLQPKFDRAFDPIFEAIGYPGFLDDGDDDDAAAPIDSDTASGEAI